MEEGWREHDRVGSHCTFSARIASTNWASFAFVLVKRFDLDTVFCAMVALVVPKNGGANQKFLILEEHGYGLFLGPYVFASPTPFSTMNALNYDGMRSNKKTKKVLLPHLLRFTLYRLYRIMAVLVTQPTIIQSIN